MNKAASMLTQVDLESRFRRSYRWMADEQRLPKLQRVGLVLIALWAINSLVNTVWAFMPSSSVEPSRAVVINAPPAMQNTTAAETIDVSSILGLAVFGQVEAGVSETLPDTTAQVNPRAGIENGAKETSLALKLTGIVASTADGLGSAMIEVRKKQELYSVGDDLPANGKVTLAKILPKQVVIDNNGTYELITLFEDNTIIGIVQTAEPTAEAEPDQVAAAPRANAQERQRLAVGYRDQLYNDPQSLAGLVSISAVQADGGLKGYRVSPGRDSAQFSALGFKAGDIVTAVNGYALSDPTNTMRLYQLMKDATDATFEIERDGTAVSINVSLSTIQ
jgi:general secretion pathway protein C